MSNTIASWLNDNIDISHTESAKNHALSVFAQLNDAQAKILKRAIKQLKPMLIGNKHVNPRCAHVPSRTAQHDKSSPEFFALKDSIIIFDIPEHPDLRVTIALANSKTPRLKSYDPVLKITTNPNCPPVEYLFYAPLKNIDDASDVLRDCLKKIKQGKSSSVHKLNKKYASDVPAPEIEERERAVTYLRGEMDERERKEVARPFSCLSKLAGYDVEQEYKIRDYRADFILKKNEQVILAELKYIGHDEDEIFKLRTAIGQILTYWLDSALNLNVTGKWIVINKRPCSDTIEIFKSIAEITKTEKTTGIQLYYVDVTENEYILNDMEGKRFISTELN